MASKIANVFKSPFSNTQNFQQGNIGVDNSRENIDPRIVTKAILGHEVILNTSGGNVIPLKIKKYGTPLTNDVVAIQIQGTYPNSGRNDVEWIDDAGNNIAQIGAHAVDAASSARHFHIKTTGNTNNARITRFSVSSGTSIATATTFRTQMELNGNAGFGDYVPLEINNDCSGAQSITIDQDSDSASRIYTISISCDNAGAGGPGGIDMSSFSTGEPLLKVPNDSTIGAGGDDSIGRIPIEFSGAIKYVRIYDS